MARAKDAMTPANDNEPDEYDALLRAVSDALNDED
jgi:hypothetical protein